MDSQHIYIFNHRTYVLTDTGGGWHVIYQSPGTSPVHQRFGDFESARCAYWRRLACAILLNPRRLHSADIDGTLLALVSDLDGRLHLARHADPGNPGGDHATAFTNRPAALTAWRDQCRELADQATAVPVPVAHLSAGTPDQPHALR